MNETLRQALSEIKDLAGRIDGTVRQHGQQLPPLLLAQSLVRLDKQRAALVKLADALTGAAARRKETS